MSKITYNNKSDWQESQYAAEYKVTASDMNEIKQVVNENSEKDIITAYNSSDFSLTQSSTYVTIPLSGNVVCGDKLTITNNQIKIGANTTKVKVSASVSLPSNSMSTGAKNFVIRKNGTIISRAWRSINPVINITINLSEKLADVQENDLIDFAFYGASGDTIASGPIFSNLTVERIE